MVTWKNKISQQLLIASICSLSVNTVSAADISTTDLLNLLVAEGVISEEKAVALVEKIRKRSENEKQVASEQESVPANTIRAPYIPDSVKENIRATVESGLRTKVTEDVVAQAKSERWGVPNALPEWVNKIKVSGDARIRYEHQSMGDGNDPIAANNIGNINNAGGLARGDRNLFNNVSDDRDRLRARARVNIKAKVTEGVDVGVRLVTGNEKNPVSSNQTLGSYKGKWDTNFDLAYIKYTSLEKDLTLLAGKFKNPFLHTDLVWDSDYNFEGIAAKWNFLRKNDLDDDFRQWDPFISVGAFPLQEIHQFILVNEENSPDSNDDKWLYAFQIGTRYEWWSQSNLTAGLAYYKYDNIRGTKNPRNSRLYDVTASPFYQLGNSTYNIATNIEGDTRGLYALATNYDLINASVKYNYAGFAPYQVWLGLDYVRNVGFKADDIAIRRLKSIGDVPDRNEGYQLDFAVGWPELTHRGAWRVGLKYRHLEGDAVLDAFADSDFLLGGTNAKGYIVSGDYAVKENVQIGAKWISADELDAAVNKNMTIDTLQIDLKTEF